jgi:hypothetical protein
MKTIVVAKKRRTDQERDFIGIKITTAGHI